MVGIILFIVFGAITVLSFGIFGLWNFLDEFIWLIKGAVPVVSFFIAIISLFIGINDIRDASARKRELALEEEKEEEVKEVKEETEKSE